MPKFNVTVFDNRWEKREKIFEAADKLAAEEKAFADDWRPENGWDYLDSGGDIGIDTVEDIEEDDDAVPMDSPPQRSGG